MGKRDRWLSNLERRTVSFAVGVARPRAASSQSMMRRYPSTHSVTFAPRWTPVPLFVPSPQELLRGTVMA